MANGLGMLTAWLLHHDPSAAGEVGGVRGVLGQSFLVQLSVILHAVGALVIAGALVGVLVAHHRRTHGEPLPTMGWTSESRIRGLIATGWGLNLLGGTMRLFQPDHPPLSDFFIVAWVQVITIKHVILAGAILASLLAIGLAPRAWQNLRPQGAAAGLVLVLLAAILGGTATTLPIPGMMDSDAGGPLGLPSQPPGEHVVRYHNITVELSATPAEPARQEIPFRVDHWAFLLSARVQWQSDLSDVRARLIDSEGRGAGALELTSPRTLTIERDTNIYPGEWRIVLESDQAVPPLVTGLREQVEVSIRMDEGTHGTRIFEETVSVTGRFFEINLWMDRGDTMRYEWSVPSAYGAVYWDIHSHPDPPAVNYHAQGRDAASSGNFTAGGDRIYSILWAPEAEMGALTLTYRIEGNFRLHSIYR